MTAKASMFKMAMPLVAVICMATAFSPSQAANEPDAYLDYVESDGHQWINLSSLKQTATMTFDADIEWKYDANNAVFIGQSWHSRNLLMVKDGTIRCMWFMGRQLRSRRHRGEPRRRAAPPFCRHVKARPETVRYGGRQDSDLFCQQF
jgi:hypothetical protein